ncbi:MAG: hypothetical protein KC933_18745 [Myxococcales bacterium]|nr:hypothetical protein [Myxococcales bacterium]MCB9651889.1 hypothetical protein [Deltaproteobacteria bacterium]
MNSHVIAAFAFLALGAAFVLPELGCGCDESLCLDTTIIEVQADEWPDGQYVFTASAEGRTRTCTLELPVASGSTECWSADELEVAPGAAGVPLRVRFLGVVESVHFTLEKDGAVVLDTDLEPEKGEKWYPNGRFCGSCQSTQAAVSVSF